MVGYLNTNNKSECFGCEACIQSCSKESIIMLEDVEGFRYPLIDKDKCVNCGLCNKVCTYENAPIRYSDEKVAFGGYIKDINVRSESTSGGAFSAIVDTWCDDNYVIFGAKADGIDVFHCYITDKAELSVFRKSKYSQSLIGSSFKDVKKFLAEGKKFCFLELHVRLLG